MSEFHCEGCEATFEHPAVEECETVDGYCALLARAGWRPVSVRVSLQAPDGDQNRHIFSKGGFICPACVGKYAAPSRPPYRRRVKRRSLPRSGGRELS